MKIVGNIVRLKPDFHSFNRSRGTVPHSQVVSIR